MESQEQHISSETYTSSQFQSQRPRYTTLFTLLIVFVLLCIGCIGFLAFQNRQLSMQLVKLRQIQNNEIPPTPSAALQSGPSTASWNIQRSNVLGIEFKIPKMLSLLDMSGKEEKGELGTQYCMVFNGSLSVVKKVYAGSGPCSGGILTLGSVSKDYSAGREGGFGDYTGYVIKDGMYYPRFINTVSTSSLPKHLVTEVTNANGVSYVKVRGEDEVFNMGGEEMTGPRAGTPGKGYIGALFNIKNVKYAGFSLALSVESPDDEQVFDQILSTFQYIDLHPSIKPTAIPGVSAVKLPYQLSSGWQSVTDKQGYFSIGFDPTTQEINNNDAYDPNLVVITTKNLDKNPYYSRYAHSLVTGIQTYNGGSRHAFIENVLLKEPISQGNTMPGYSEKEYVVEGKNCLVLYGISISQTPTTYGMCPMRSDTAFYFQSYDDEASLTKMLRTVKFLK